MPTRLRQRQAPRPPPALGVIYKGKDARPVFVEEPDRIVVVTVYVYLNQREESR